MIADEAMISPFVGARFQQILESLPDTADEIREYNVHLAGISPISFSPNDGREPSAKSQPRRDIDRRRESKSSI